MLYFPQPALVLGQLPANIEALSFHSDGETLKGIVLNPGKPKALLYFGGNAESVEQNIPFFSQLDIEYSVYLVPYRGYGHSTGSPSEQALYRDANSIFDTLNEKHQSIVLMGRSLGTGVATHLAARKEIEKLILVTPYDSIENVAKSVYWMFPISWLMKDKFRSWENTALINVPVLSLTAERDEVIPRVRTDALLSGFDARYLTSILINKATHNDISLFPEFSQAIRGFLSANGRTLSALEETP